MHSEEMICSRLGYACIVWPPHQARSLYLLEKILDILRCAASETGQRMTKNDDNY